MAGVDYLITARGISGAAFNENVGTIRYLRVPTNVAIPTPAMATSSKTDLAKWVKEVRDIADGDPNQNSISVAGDILVFIHGYNNDLDIIMKRQRQLAKDLKAEGWKGLVIGFDWPSDNETLAYWQDRSKGAEVAVKLVSDCITVLAQGQEKDCVTNVASARPFHRRLCGHGSLRAGGEGRRAVQEQLARQPGRLHRRRRGVVEPLGERFLVGADVQAHPAPDQLFKPL